MGIITLISNALGVLKGWLGIQSKKLELRNTARMEDNAERQDEQRAVDKTQVAISKGDINEIRKELSE
jgi:hypothetical protein